MKKIVKDVIGDFRVLLDHSYRPYDVSPPHVLRRITLPLCEDITTLLKEGTRNDAWEALEGWATECRKASLKARREDPMTGRSSLV